MTPYLLAIDQGTTQRRRTSGLFKPSLDETARHSLFEGWREAVERCLAR